MGQMKIHGAALAFAIVASYGGATGHECPSEPIADQLDTWSQVYSAFERYAHCDDGALAEQFSQSVVRLLAEHWESLPEAAALGSKNPAFEAFMLRHIDVTTDWNDLRKVAGLADTQCPREHSQLCRTILGRVGDAHVDDLRTLEHADAAQDVQAAIRGNDLRFLGIAGYVVEVPGAETSRHLHEKYGVRVIEGTSDVVFGREHSRLIGVARRYARQYNALLLK